MTRRELFIVVTSLALAIALLAAIGGSVLWTRPLWFDELCCVSYIVGDGASPVEIVRRVAHSWDYAPPLLHLIVWPFAALAGGDVTPILLRSISLVAVSAALLLVYATLRRRFSPLASAGGALAVAGHSLVIGHAFEGRFYGPWLLFAAGFAWSLGIQNARRRSVSQAFFAVFLTTIHWYGIFSLALMCAGVFLTYRSSVRDRLRFIAPSLAGLAALLVTAPMALAQRVGAHRYQWVPELEITQVVRMTTVFWVSAVTVLAAAVILTAALRSGEARASIRGHVRDPGVAALGALVLMPAILVVLSIVFQPSMVERYAIVGALAWAPLVAFAIAAVGRLAGTLLVAVLLLILALTVEDVILVKQEFASDVAFAASAFEKAKTLHVPIVFWGLHNIYPVAGPQRSPRTLARYLDLPDSTFVSLFPSDAMEPVRKKYRLDRDQARGHARTYGFPILASQEQLDSSPRFVLLSGELSLPGGYKQPDAFGRALFPHHRVTRIDPLLYIFERGQR